MARRIVFGNDALEIYYSGLDLFGSFLPRIRVPYASVKSVRVGVDALPGLGRFAGFSAGPFADYRRGYVYRLNFRAFYDVKHRERAVQIDFEGNPQLDRVVVEPDTDPQALADELTARTGRA